MCCCHVLLKGLKGDKGDTIQSAAQVSGNVEMPNGYIQGAPGPPGTPGQPGKKVQYSNCQ